MSQVPICLDLGTNTQRYLDDPLYIGVRRPRPTGQEVSKTIKRFFVLTDSPIPDGRIHGRVHASDQGRIPQLARPIRGFLDGQCI